MTTRVKIEADPYGPDVSVHVLVQDAVYGPQGATTEVRDSERHVLEQGGSLETYIHQTRRITVIEVLRPGSNEPTPA